MKYIWEPEDIKPGLRTKPQHAKEVWMVGYDSAVTGEDKYFMVSTLDGMMSARGLDARVSLIISTERGTSRCPRLCQRKRASDEQAQREKKQAHAWRGS